MGEDGKTAYERLKGKRPTVMGLEFGEKRLYRVKKKGPKLERINPLWNFGIFVGVRKRSNEILVANFEGVHSVRTVHRIPQAVRWGESCVKWVVWAPWHALREAKSIHGVCESAAWKKRRVRARTAS